MEKQTPKELFLIKLYGMMREFEEATGVEVHEIKMERVNVTTNVDEIDKTVIERFYLILK